MCWMTEWINVSWTSVSINTKYCIFKRTNKIVSVTGKIVENKLENIITEMLYLAHNRIGLAVWHMGCSYYLYLPSVKLPGIFLSGHVDIGCSIFKVHTYDLTPFCGRTKLSAVSGNSWRCWSAICGLESIFLYQRMRREMSGEGTALWVRELSVALPKEISSLHLLQSFLWDKASFLQYLAVSLYLDV